MLINRDQNSLLNIGHKFKAFDTSEIAVLGGTGFIGQWVLQALEEYRNNLGINTNVTVYTRNSKRAHQLLINEMNLSLIIKEIDFTKQPVLIDKADYFICAATPSRIKTGLDDPNNVYLSALNSSKSVLLSASSEKNIPKVLNLSSGIVYGKQPLLTVNQQETVTRENSNSSQGYKNAKIISEEIFEQATREGIVKSISPRLFAFFGPGIDFNEHFAIGNFLRDGLNNSKIRINGNPNTIRSYMYPTDLVTWLFSALINPVSENVNIGSEKPIDMLDLAKIISNQTCRLGVEVNTKEEESTNYVPSTTIFRRLYGVSETISIEEGLDRWIEWHYQSMQNKT
jgi:nucleoside-diphosphate-sugar epimerase